MDLSAFIPKNQYRYHFSSLDVTLQQAYEVLLQGYLEQRGSISVAIGNETDIQTVHHAICYDVPEIFYVKNVFLRHTSISKTMTVCPEYRFDERVRIEILQSMMVVATRFTQSIAMLSEEERVKKLHDYLVSKVVYKDAHASYSHEAPGALLYGISVCEGLAKAFKYMADRSKLRSMVVIGDAKNLENPGSGTGHAWNIVYVEGCTYHLDVTFNQALSKAGILRYDYYMLSDSQIRGDHRFQGMVQCEMPTEYYEQNGLFVDGRYSLERVVKGRLTPTMPLVFKMPSIQGEQEKIIHQVLRTVADAVPLQYANEFHVSISCNLQRMIFQANLIPKK